MQRPVPVWFFRSYLVFWGTRTRSSYVFIDCEQSLFFFRFSESNARARERRSAISHARGHLRVSRFARRTTEKRETARSLMFSYIQCVHPIQDYMIHSVGIITDLIVFVCLFVLADWERGIDSHGRVYYIDHINRTTTWVRPRRSKQFTSTRPSPNQTSVLTYYLG